MSAMSFDKELQILQRSILVAETYACRLGQLGEKFEKERQEVLAKVEAALQGIERIKAVEVMK